MKKFNLQLDSFDEDDLRELDRKWNEPLRQPMNGGEFNSKGEFNLDWDRYNGGSSRFVERGAKIEGLLEKSVGKKFDEVYSKLCRSGLADKPLWGWTCREQFLSYFNVDRWRRAVDYTVDDDGIIRKVEQKKRKKPSKDIKIPYDKPLITYKVNHRNLESISDEFIKNFGRDLYCYLQSVDEVSEDWYLKNYGMFSSTRGDNTMSTRRAKEFKPRYYYSERNASLPRFIFDQRYQIYSEIIPYGTKKYWEYIRQQKRKNKYTWKSLSPDQKEMYDAMMKWRKHFDNIPKNFEDSYNLVFCGIPLPDMPDEKRNKRGKSRWKKN